MNKPRGPIAVLIVATTLGVSGCALEIWEGSVFTASGDTLFRDTFCRVVRVLSVDVVPECRVLDFVRISEVLHEEA